MDWLGLTFLSVFFRSIYGVMTKVLSNQVQMSIYSQATLLSLAAAIITLFASPLLGGLSIDFSETSLALVLTVALSQGLGNIVYFASIKRLTNSTAQIAFSSILIFNTSLALLLFNLRLSGVNLLGLALLAFAIYLATTGKLEIQRRGVILMLLAAFIFSLFQLSSSKISSEVNPVTYLLISYLGSSAVVFAVKWRVVIEDFKKVPIQQLLRVPALTAIPSFATFLFSYYAYRSAPEPAKVAMLLTSQVVLTVILSYFFLREKGQLIRKSLAAILVLISAILIKS